ncbi:TetR/AcrR family transcriptional regulator [Hwanghaeella grinnelliae]|uniref:TetR/AcrR family transcriptional regulator n=1 Tax=Hwanghaeella grinnelliae TaxID=2500179 RepID=A0A437QYL4_9PROT|nr:TetR/AcrR family transcriptional regulator [Hwanghaeella grinnelliae]RVU39583.1 TetR/AcrR family transcriptional regulator [Hwanghaeella grinnelliae]
MRVSREVAEENRKRVVETAGRLFRRHGYDGIGVAALMKAAGLTQGGFYKQFEDKSALVAEATESALAENRKMLEDAIAASDSPPCEAIARWYLSPSHVDMTAEGCCFAALAAEAPRQGEEVQSIFREAMEASLDLMTGPDGDRKEAMRQLSTMVGALVLARAAGSDGLANELMDAARLKPSRKG